MPLMRGRELKLKQKVPILHPAFDAPYAGARIET